MSSTMTYEPKVGDIVSLRARVVKIDLTHMESTRLVPVDGPEVGQFIWVNPKDVTLMERPKRELKPGDRAVCTGDLNYPNREYIWSGHYWTSTPHGYTHNREDITFDSEPEIWTYYPRNETPEA